VTISDGNKANTFSFTIVKTQASAIGGYTTPSPNVRYARHRHREREAGSGPYPHGTGASNITWTDPSNTVIGSGNSLSGLLQRVVTARPRT